MAINGKTRYIFAPSLINMPTPIETETGFYCPLVQSNSYMVRMAVPMKHKNLLSPVVHLKYDADTIAIEINDQIGRRLGVNRKKVKKAIHYALDIQEQFIKELCQRGQEILENMGQDEPVIIVTGSADEKVLAAARQMGANNVLSKPLSVPKLKAAIEAVTGKLD